MKILLCISLLALCVLLAFLLTRKYRLRKDFYYNFALFNERLLNEVSYTKIPLPAFIEKYTFGGDFYNLLLEKKKSGFESGQYDFSYLSEDERKFTADYFKMIGKSDAPSQKTYLASVRNRIEDKRQKSEESYKKYFALYIKLGFLAGLALIILII